jgi:hypothetical protein
MDNGVDTRTAAYSYWKITIEIIFHMILVDQSD